MNFLNRLFAITWLPRIADAFRELLTDFPALRAAVAKIVADIEADAPHSLPASAAEWPEWGTKLLALARDLMADFPALRAAVAEILADLEAVAPTKAPSDKPKSAPEGKK